MRRILSILIPLFILCGAFFAQGDILFSEGSSHLGQEPQQPTRVINLKSDLSGPVSPGDSVIFLVGNFAAQHNGAVITCDSAVRYSDKRIEFFGNVLINKNTTYIYGDRAEYDGDLNRAVIYSDIVKVKDGDATLYTYKFLFDTKENIGEFGGGGVMVNRDNVMESERGYYYADTKELVCVGAVEMRNNTYELKGDSVVYNMASDNAYFFDRTNIWDSKGDYLYADRGEYHKADTLYLVTRNGYLLTEKQELWSDSVDYYRTEQHVILRNNIQIDDKEHKILAFGDYAEYWGEPGDAFLTREPSVVTYDLSQGDSVFMRADSIYLHTLDWLDRSGQGRHEPTPSVGDTLAEGMRPIAADSLMKLPPREEELSDGELPARDVEETDVEEENPENADEEDVAVDSLSGEKINPLDTMTVKQRTEYLKRQAREAERERKRTLKQAQQKLKQAKLKEIAAKRRAKTNAKLDAQKEREERRLQARRVKAEARLKLKQTKALRKGKKIKVDSTELRELDSLLEKNITREDSLFRMMMEEWSKDSTEMAVSPDSLYKTHGEVYRLLKGFRNVRIFRSDFQCVCDSMTAASNDSMVHMYIRPVLWSGENQITSDVMDLYTKNGELSKACFVGSPMMAGRVDSTYYNQIAGKDMTAFFYKNEISQMNVDGNAQTLYFNQDGEPPVVVGMFFVESGGINFYFDKRQISRMAWYNEPHYSIFPLDKIPEDQPRKLKGFEWQADRRPTRDSVFTRTIRHTRAEERKSEKHPEFPIRKRIDEDRKRLTESRAWSDREELVDPLTEEWMHELGFEVGQPRKEPLEM